MVEKVAGNAKLLELQAKIGQLNEEMKELRNSIRLLSSPPVDTRDILRRDLLRLQPSQATSIFVDGGALYGVMRVLKKEMDYKKLYELFCEPCQLRRAFYFYALNRSDEFNPLVRLADWLRSNSWTTVERPLFLDSDHGMGQTRSMGVGVDIAVQMIREAEYSKSIFLFSGSSELYPLVEDLQTRGCVVTVVHTASGTNSDLRKLADHFVAIEEIMPFVEKLRTAQVIRDDSSGRLSLNR